MKNGEILVSKAEAIEFGKRFGTVGSLHFCGEILNAILVNENKYSFEQLQIYDILFNAGRLQGMREAAASKKR